MPRSKEKIEKKGLATQAEVYELAKIGVPIYEICKKLGIAHKEFTKSPAFQEAYDKGEAEGLSNKLKELYGANAENGQCAKIWLDRYSARQRARLNRKFKECKTLKDKMNALDQSFFEDGLPYEAYERILDCWRKKYELETLIDDLRELKNNVSKLTGNDLQTKINEILNKIEGK